jgi:hypothetical protein
VALLSTKVAKVAKVAAMTEQQKAAKPTGQRKVFTGRPVAPAGYDQQPAAWSRRTAEELQQPEQQPMDGSWNDDEEPPLPDEVEEAADSAKDKKKLRVGFAHMLFRTAELSDAGTNSGRVRMVRAKYDRCHGTQKGHIADSLVHRYQREVGFYDGSRDHNDYRIRREAERLR